MPPAGATTTGRAVLIPAVVSKAPPANCKAAPPGPVAPRAASLLTAKVPPVSCAPPVYVLLPVSVTVPGPFTTTTQAPASGPPPIV